jgi:hypothetical protein
MACRARKGNKFMSEPTKPEPMPDDLTKTTNTNTIELTEEHLQGVSGGVNIMKVIDKTSPLLTNP